MRVACDESDLWYSSYNNIVMWVKFIRLTLNFIQILFCIIAKIYIEYKIYKLETSQNLKIKLLFALWYNTTI